MWTTRPRRATKDRSRLVLGVAIALLGLGAVLLVASLTLGFNPDLRAFGNGLRIPVPYLFLVGLGLLVLYAVLRPNPDAGSHPQVEPTLFGKDTTVFASQLGDGADEASDAGVNSPNHHPPSKASRSDP